MVLVYFQSQSRTIWTTRPSTIVEEAVCVSFHSFVMGRSQTDESFDLCATHNERGNLNKMSGKNKSEKAGLLVVFGEHMYFQRVDI